MSKAMYIGVNDPAYTQVSSNTTGAYSLDTGLSTYFGFEIKFKLGPKASQPSNNYLHILNYGGSGNATRFCFSVQSNGTISVEAPTTNANVKPPTIGAAVIPAANWEDVYTAKYIINTTAGTGTFTLNGVDIGTATGITLNTNAGVAGRFCNTGGTGTANRPINITIYYLKIYYGETLVKTYLPKSINGVGGFEASDGTTTADVALSGNATATYTAAADKAHKVSKLYVGDSNGTARKVVKAYVGDSNNTARLFYSG